MNTLANDLYTVIVDMDFMDYEENLQEDLENLLSDLELLEKQGNGALLNLIKMLLEN